MVFGSSHRSNVRRTWPARTHTDDTQRLCMQTGAIPGHGHPAILSSLDALESGGQGAAVRAADVRMGIVCCILGTDAGGMPLWAWRDGQGRAVRILPTVEEVASVRMTKVELTTAHRDHDTANRWLND